MEDTNKKRKTRVILVAVLSLFVLILGAAYAYFQVTTTDNFGTKNIYVELDDYGSVIIEGVDATLTLDLDASDLEYDYTQQTPAPVIYYAGTSGATTTPTEVTVGVARVNPNTDTNYYHCTYDISVTHSGTNDMYDKFNGKTGNVYNYTNRSEGQIALLINGVEYDWGSEDGMPSLIHADLYMRGTETKNITAGLKFVSSDQIDQSYITGTDIDIEVNLVPNTLRCTVFEPASTTLIALTEDSNNSSKISRYTGPVTDECGANSCTTVNQAQNVYIFKSNDINNVIFEEYCWKIIRTTESGGIKLLYNGLPLTNVDHQECTATGSDTVLTEAQMNTFSNGITYSQGGAYDKPAYVGYMYNPNSLSSNYYDQIRADNVNQSDSLFKEKIEYWFSNSNIDESKLEDAVYCNDRSLDSTSPVTEAQLASTTSGNVYFKNYNTVSTLECTNITDSFNTTNTKAQTNYKVGFMTEPERYLVGLTSAANGQYYWLGSPNRFRSGNAIVPNVSSTGYSINFSVDNSKNVRPVVSINTSVHITDGDGSTTSPFIFE